MQHVAGKPAGESEKLETWHRWEDNIKMDYNELGRDDARLDSTCSGRGVVAGSFEYGGEPSSRRRERTLPSNSN
jgi:hypothetical protein